MVLKSKGVRTASPQENGREGESPFAIGIANNNSNYSNHPICLGCIVTYVVDSGRKEEEGGMGSN